MKGIKAIILAAGLALSTLTFAAEPGQINLNTATAEQLAALNGIGKAKAEAIIQYRNENGNFKSLDDLKSVKGIGTAILDKNRDLLALE
ncbi:MAG: hypothetical protein CMI03_01050 [Oceanospirillaceae bacterium]|uniref:ComEA family DNA-binding protein n=1 Tax=unclassified Thalassolituus TaxID=2624967 RepID=UPI000C5E478A|nr:MULTISPECIES: ComEA family DNA-binding protein [unclassified Thalassolituus]MAS24073.1 hypothetical protein [Oceanospirillaceae bacterium]MBL35182.1 hypothetical protein [Oceanospirillaceae bacterium]MBS51328.1 hypothetical protein [Oceanospirillaceae bacterium]|tara:strand:- start:1477 stop:1743 length:267 start_codon:yes stop_codon:yes gene_type:complete